MIYTFRCKECGTDQEVITPTRDKLEIPECCGKKMVRNFRADIPRTQMDSYRTPIHSDALAIAPCQRAEHEQQFPDIALDEECRPVFDRYDRHQKYLDEIGAVKNPQRSRNGGSASRTITMSEIVKKNKAKSK